jgi:hypothetical protein
LTGIRPSFSGAGRDGRTTTEATSNQSDSSNSFGEIQTDDREGSKGTCWPVSTHEYSIFEAQLLSNVDGMERFQGPDAEDRTRSVASSDN